MKKRVLYTVILSTLLCLFTRCVQYKASNMLGENDVDVTYLIKKKHYKPIYNKGGNIVSLVNPSPYILTNDDVVNIRLYLAKRTSLLIEESALREKMKYSKTYFITDFPVDCFELYVEQGGKKYFLEIRKEDRNGEIYLILPENDDEARFYQIK